MKRPATQFYWADHFRDPGIRASSFAAQGVWWNLLCMMHEGEPYGHLTVGGAAPSEEDLAQMVGGSLENMTKLLAELERKRVFSRTPEGLIYSRRMVRDEQKRQAHAEAGRLGGNPNLTNSPDKSGVNSKVKGIAESRTNQKPTPSSSSSTSKATTPAGARYAFMAKIRPVWRTAYGGEIPEGSARTLEPLINKHGEDLVVARLTVYVGKTPGQYASIPKFKATFGTWDSDVVKQNGSHTAPDPGRHSPW